MSHTLPTLLDADLPSAVDDAGFGALQTERGHLPLRALDVRTRIDGLVYSTVLTQRFTNVFTEPLEAAYIFPLPDRAAVTGFRLEVAGRVVEAELRERGEAREQYDEAIKKGHRAAIAEEERPGVFTVRVGNLPAGEDATVRLTLAGPLATDYGEATFRFPLVVAPRYIPGKALPGPSVGDGTVGDTDAVPDASRITPPVLLPGFPNPVRLSLAVELHPAGLEIADPRSSLHTVVERTDPDGTRHLSLQPGERLDRDFVLRFRLAGAAVRPSLVVRPDASGDGGTFALTVVPPSDSGRTGRPRDVAFVLDRSGSMGGWKMLAARRALARMVESLTAHDRFAVLAFDDDVDPFPTRGGLLPATDANRFRASEFLAKVDARGGTEMARPLGQAVQLLGEPSKERDRLLVLVTDGQVGNEDQLLRTLGGRLHSIRVFTLGVDTAVNEAFLRRFAGLGGGYSEVVESEDRLDAVMAKVQRRLGAPVLTGLKLEPAGMRFEPEALVPAPLPDLFPGTPLTVFGRYRGKADGGMAVQARDDAGMPVDWTVTAAPADTPALANLWARGRLRVLGDRYVTATAGREALEKQIVGLSLQYGVLCRFTAMVAVDVKEVVNPGGELHRVTQPVEVPAGWVQPHTEMEVLCRGAYSTGFAAGASIPSPPAMRSRGWLGFSAPSAPEDFESAAEDMDSLSESVTDMDAMVRASRAPRKSKAKRPPAGTPDLTAYRRRAEELLERLAATTSPNLRQLGVLVVQLEALLDDLRSVGAPDAELRPLADLVGELQSVTAARTPDPDEVNRLWALSLERLTAFAASAPAPKKRSWFWK